MSLGNDSSSALEAALFELAVYLEGLVSIETWSGSPSVLRREVLNVELSD